MNFFDVVWQNKEVFKLLFTIAVGLICFFIVLRTDRLFKISSHQGIRYFRNAFFFYGAAFIMRYILGQIHLISNAPQMYSSIATGVFEFFLIMAGFSLLYSLLWRKFEPEGGIHSSLFNTRFLIFYLLALTVVLLDYVWATYAFIFSVQIILFIFATAISYSNYQKSKDRAFLKLYFIVILLNLIAWVANFLVATLFEWHTGGVIGIYILNLVIFLLFLYGVMKVTDKNKL
jgi:hypothetical protein